MSMQEVCRLCLSKDNLVWVFDKRLERTDHMKDVILITTGVEIHSKDVISQKICTKCGQDAIKMFQFRQKSLKNDRYLKAQCRDLLKHTNLKIPNTNVTIKTERIEKEKVKEEPRRRPLYKVHPTMTALSRKYPQMQFPSICLLSNVDPCISMEMDIVENYFKSRNLSMRKYVQVALRASDKNIPEKSPTMTKSSKKFKEYSANNRITDHSTQSTSTAISKTVGSAEVVHKVSPINIKLIPSGYTIVRPSTDNINNGKVKNVCESTNACERLTTDSPESQSGINESKKRRLSNNEVLSEPQTKKFLNANTSNMTPVPPSVEKKPPPVFKCNICSSVQYSAKHLKKHQIRHARCKFCKLQFRSVGMKQQHMKYSCLVKEALNSLPDVEVEKVELNRKVRLHYHDAFNTFPPLPGLENIDSTSKFSRAADEIIEIISDDEDTPANSLPTKQICPINSAPTTSVVTVIKPDVNIKNDNILDSIKTQASELDIIKELLYKFRELQSVTGATQTELPTTELIEVNEEKLTAELKNLKQVLYSYQIPVKIQKGSIISASYNYQSIPPRSRKLSLWNDLTPIDFQTENDLISDQIPNSEHVTAETPVTHSNDTGSVNNDQTSLQDIGIVIPASSNRSAPSDSAQSKSSTIRCTQTESLIPTPESFTAVQAEPATVSVQSSFKRLTQNGKKLPASLEIFLVPAASPIGDISIRRHSPDSFGTDQPTPRVDSHSLELYPLQSISPIANTPNGQHFSEADQTISAYINSESFRKSDALNKSDVNANWSSSNTQSETIDCSVITRQDLTNKAVEYVFNNCSESVGTGTINVRPSNGVVYGNNNQKPFISRPRTLRRHPDFSKKTANCSDIRFPPVTNSSISSHNLLGNNVPIQRTVLNDNNVFIKPPPPYPRGSTPANQTPQPYILSHGKTNSSNVSHTRGYYNAYHQYIAQRQELGSSTVTTAGTYTPKAMLDSAAQCGRIGYFPASNPLRNSIENHSILRSPRSTEPSYCHVIESSVTFPNYSKTSNYVNAPSVIVSPVNQNCDVSNRQLPNTCTNSSTPAARDTLTDSVPATDKSQHFTSGLIRVRNVCELT